MTEYLESKMYLSMSVDLNTCFAQENFQEYASMNPVPQFKILFRFIIDSKI